jgi:hypothetical protein
VSAVAPVLPPATAAAKLAKSETNADLIAMASPAETDDAVIDTFVWLAMLSRPVNKAFQLDAAIASPADTADIALWLSPKFNAPVPAKWLYPNGSLVLPMNALYSSSKIASPAEYAINLFNPYYALC